MWKARENGLPPGATATAVPDAQTLMQVRQLEQQLAAREQEMEALREIAEAASQVQEASKVIELSKKNRSLNLLLEKERLKVAKLQQTLSQQAAALQDKPASGGDSKNAAAAAADEHAQEVAALKQQLSQLTNRMGQMEQKVFLLDGENKKLTRALLREVGEGIPLAKLLEEGSGADWKGRREQIIRLQDTIKQLKEAAGTGATPAAGSSSAKHETAHRNLIGKLNKQKDSELQRMAAELEAAKQAAEQLRLKFTGASSRRKVLEEEVTSLKDKLSVVLGKTQNDDKLIAALRSELLAVATKGGGSSRSAGAGLAAGDGSFEVSQQRCSQLEEQVEQQQKVIRYLQAQLESSKGAAGSNFGAAAAAGLQPHESQQLLAECEQLRRQIAVLQLAAAGGGGGGGGASALQQQVLLLQEENASMRQELVAGARHLHLTRSDMEVLEAAKESVGAIGEGDEEEAGSEFVEEEGRAVAAGGVGAEGLEDEEESEVEQ